MSRADVWHQVAWVASSVIVGDALRLVDDWRGGAFDGSCLLALNFLKGEIAVN